MNRLKTRLIITLAAVWIAIMAANLGSGTGPFIHQLGSSPADINELSASIVENNLAAQGDCYVVYDMIGYGYTEHTSKYTSSTTTTTDNYYWLVDCGENDLMLVKTRANDSLADKMDEMVDAYWDAETWDDYVASFTSSAYLDGVFIKNDPEIVGFYQEWVDDMGEYNDSWKGLTLAPCTLDCTRTFAVRVREFYIGAAMLAALIVGGIIAIISIVKSSKAPKAQFSGAYAGGIPSGGSYDTYGSASYPQNNTPYGTQSDTFSSQNRTYATQQGGSFQTQSGTSYGTQQSGTSYGTQQSGTSYGTQQSGSAYGTQQSGSSYGTQQSGTAYGTQQSGTSYGTQQRGTAYGTQQSGSAYSTQQSGTSYGTQQSGTSYGTQQSGTSYGTQQSGTAYGTQQSGSSYGTQQSGSAYGTQQSGSSYGTQQSGINYGSTMGTSYTQSGVNYGSTMGGSLTLNKDSEQS